jgi:hypothetical protein
MSTGFLNNFDQIADSILLLLENTTQMNSLPSHYREPWNCSRWQTTFFSKESEMPPKEKIKLIRAHPFSAPRGRNPPLLLSLVLMNFLFLSQVSPAAWRVYQKTIYLGGSWASYFSSVRWKIFKCRGSDRLNFLLRCRATRHKFNLWKLKMVLRWKPVNYYFTARAFVWAAAEGKCCALNGPFYCRTWHSFATRSTYSPLANAFFYNCGGLESKLWKRKSSLCRVQLKMFTWKCHQTPLGKNNEWNNLHQTSTLRGA